MKNILLSLGVIATGVAMFQSFAYGAGLSGVVCTMDYNPVCASVPVQCIMAPCNPVKETFANSCIAKAKGATSFVSGTCESSNTPREAKKTPRQALQDGTWILKSLNGNAIVGTGTMNFTKNSFSAKLCNTMKGQYGVFRNTLMLRKIMSTRMYCEGEFMSIESILSQSPRLLFSVGSDTLTITGKHGDIMIWKKN